MGVGAQCELGWKKIAGNHSLTALIVFTRLVGYLNLTATEVHCEYVLCVVSHTATSVRLCLLS